MNNTSFLSVGISGSYQNASNLLDVNSKSLQVIPSFVLTFSNIIIIALAREKLMVREKTLHGEVAMSFSQTIKPEGIIRHELNVVDIIDKGKGTLFIFTSKL